MTRRRVWRRREATCPGMQRPHRRNKGDYEAARSGASKRPRTSATANGFHGWVVLYRAIQIFRSPARVRGLAARFLTVVQSPRGQAAPVSSKPLSIVRRISGKQAFRRSAGGLDEPAGRPVERDQEVRRHGRARVIQHARLVRQIEGAKVQAAREPASPLEGAVGVPGDGRPGAVELPGAAVTNERLQRMQAEPLHMRRQRGQRDRAAHVRDPWTRRRLLCHVVDGAVRHAQDHQVGVAAAREEAALGQARAHGRSETAVPNDLDFLEHRPSRQAVLFGGSLRERHNR